MKIQIGFAERAFGVISLSILSGVLIYSVYEQSGVDVGNTTEGLIGVQISCFAIYAISLCLSCLRWKNFIYAATRDKFLLILIGITVASVLWSDAPELTTRRGIAILGTTLFGWYFACRYTLKEQLQLFAWSLGISAVLSVLLAIGLPSYGVMSTQEGGAHAGKWRGVYVHKNVLGRTMVLSTVVFLLIASGSRKYRWLAWTLVALSVILILLSNSKTALILLLAFLVFLRLSRTLRWHYNVLIFLLMTVVVVIASVGILLVGNLDNIADATGLDLSLTGRTDIWAAAFDKILERPWLGYGYGGFWLGLDGESRYIWLATKWTAPHSHNGFVDLCLDLGFIGLFFYLLSFLNNCIQAVRLVRSSRTSEGFWPLMYLTYLLLANLTESSILRQNDLSWVLYVALSVSMNKKSNV